MRQNFPEHVGDDVVIIPNGCAPGRVHPLVDRNELKASLGRSPRHKSVVYIDRIAVEKNVQAIADAVKQLEESRRVVIIGPQYVPLERLGPRGDLLFAFPIQLRNVRRLPAGGGRPG